jgi:hypothetical protein
MERCSRSALPNASRTVFLVAAIAQQIPNRGSDRIQKIVESGRFSNKCVRA